MTAGTISPTNSTQSKRHLRRGLAAFAVAALLGPIVGSLPFLLIFMVALAVDAGEPASLIGFIQTTLGIALVTTLYGFILGGVQALLSGLWIGVRTWRNGWVSYKETALTALAVSLAAAVVLAYALESSAPPQSPPIHDDTLGLSALLAVLSLVSALVCRWLMARMGIIR